MDKRRSFKKVLRHHGATDCVFAIFSILKCEKHIFGDKTWPFFSPCRHCNVVPTVWTGQWQCHTGWQRRLLFQWNKKFHQQHRPESDITGPLWGRVSTFMLSFLRTCHIFMITYTSTELNKTFMDMEYQWALDSLRLPTRHISTEDTNESLGLMKMFKTG